MFLEEKENFEKDDSSNIENDFKELDNEINRVIHGEATFEEEKKNKSILDNIDNINIPKNSTEIFDNINENSKNLIGTLNYIGNKITQKNIIINKNNNLDDKKYINQTPPNISRNLNKYPNNIISPLNNICKNNVQNKKINSNYSDNIQYFKNENLNSIFQKTNNDLNNNNTQKLNKVHNTEYIINSIHNHNQNNMYNNYNNYSQNNFNYFNINGCINLNNNKKNLEPCINNINNWINNFGNKRDVININQNYNPIVSQINEQLIKNFHFSKNQEKSLFNNYNQINNNNNYIHNYININVPFMPISYNQLLPNNNIIQNYIILNQINNLKLNNQNISNDNINFYLQNNNFNNFFINNNIIQENSKTKEKDDENMLYELLNKREKQKKNFKQNNNLFSKNNSNNINSIDLQNNTNNSKATKKANSNKIISNYNPEKNCHVNKRKIFNKIPDSEKEKNIINLIDILQYKDTRTTLMIKNIPNKYTISTFLDEIGDYFKDTYDIFYLPIDYINKCNLGFAFINFVEPFHIILFYELYRGKKWKRFNSDKKCELLYAKFQGKKELIAHFEKGKVLSFDSEEKKPLILPTPNPLPRINLPIYFLNLFIKLYPKISYEIKEDCKSIIDKYMNSFNFQVFSINGNFKRS